MKIANEFNNTNTTQSETGDSLMTVVPDFFYDIFCRIIPGAVFIGIYWPTAITEAEDAVSVFWILLVAWAVGLTLDKFGYVFWDLVIKLIRKIIPKKLPDLTVQCLLKWEIISDRFAGQGDKHFLLIENKKEFYQLPFHERRSIVRDFAEKVFFRVMLSICVIMMIWKPETLMDLIHAKRWSNIFWGIVGTFVFALGWWSCHNAALNQPSLGLKQRKVNEGKVPN